MSDKIAFKTKALLGVEMVYNDTRFNSLERGNSPKTCYILEINIYVFDKIAKREKTNDNRLFSVTDISGKQKISKICNIQRIQLTRLI